MNTSDFYSRSFKSSAKMFSQVLCYCMCKQTKFQDPSISCGTSPSLLLKQRCQRRVLAPVAQTLRVMHRKCKNKTLVSCILILADT